MFGDGNEICVTENAHLEFGNKFKLTARTNILCTKKIKFGNDCLVGWENRIMDTDIHKIFNDKGRLKRR